MFNLRLAGAFCDPVWAMPPCVTRDPDSTAKFMVPHENILVCTVTQATVSLSVDYLYIFLYIYIYCKLTSFGNIPEA
jgi:hypothetical protein